MNRSSRRIRIGRAVVSALVLVCAVMMQGASCAPFAPEVARFEARSLAFVDTPAGSVDTAGGNLSLARKDLDIDTPIGNVAVEAVWNSAAAEWLWNFDMSYDGETFVDDRGALHDVSATADGEPIPGTYWARVDAQTMKTKGGKVFTFGPTGRLEQVRWNSETLALLQYTTAVIAGTEHVTQIDACRLPACTLVYTIGYDAAGRVVNVVDRAGRQAGFTYDAGGRLVTARDALDVAEGWPGWRYEYQGSFLTAVTNSEDERSEISYEDGRVSAVKQIGAGDPAWSFSYFGFSGGKHTTVVTNPLGGRRTFRFDFHRRLQSIVDEVGDTTSWTWSGQRPASMTTAWSETTSWTYQNDDVATEAESTGRVLTYTYDPNGVDRDQPKQRAVVSISDNLGTVTARTYDASGRLLSIANGAGETTSFAYTPYGELDNVTAPTGVVVRLYAYGEHGHPLAISSPIHTAYAVYDDVGNLLEGPDLTPPDGAGLGGVVSRSFDADRNVAAIVLSDLDSTTSTTAMTVTSTSTVDFEWRSDHRRTAIRRPYGGDTEFGYDAIGRLSERRTRVDGAWETTVFEHDAAGNLAAVERANGMRTERAYDLAGRQVALSHLRDAVLESTVTFGWSNGLVASLLDSVHGAPEVWTRDPHGRVTEISYPGGESLEIGYDIRSRPISRDFVLHLPAGPVVLRALAFGYDGADRGTALYDGGTEILADTYTAGQLAERRYGNGLRRTFETVIDPDTPALSRTTTTVSDLYPGITLEHTTNDRGDCWHSGVVADCVTVETTTDNGYVTTTTERYQLSKTWLDGPGGQRVGRWTSSSTGDPTETYYYSYDELSNLVAIGDASGVDDLLYNAERNRLVEVQRGGQTVAAYTYDEAGFVTSRAGETITWTASGRVATIGTARSFAWDSLGRPISRTAGAESVAFLFGGAVEAAPDASPYGHLPLRLDLGAVQLELDGSNRLYRHFDFRNNVKFTTDDYGSGLALTHYHYSAYGLEAITGPDGDERRFAQGHDLGELVRLGARIYDPLVARFLSPDPIYQLFDQYAYTMGNPVDFWDPGGASFWKTAKELAKETGREMRRKFRELKEFECGRSGCKIKFYPPGSGDPPECPVCVPPLPDSAPVPRLPAQTHERGLIDGSGGGSVGGEGLRDGFGGDLGGCSQAPTRIPGARTLLGVLLPLQLIAAFLVFRRWKAR